MPGSEIPIISEKTSRSMNPNYFLVLPWHFKENFIAREKKFLAPNFLCKDLIFFLNLKGLFLPKPIPEAGFNSILLVGIFSILLIIFLNIWAKRRQNITGEQFPIYSTSAAILIIPVFFAPDYKTDHLALWFITIFTYCTWK